MSTQITIKVNLMHFRKPIAFCKSQNKIRILLKNSNTQCRRQKKHEQCIENEFSVR